MHYNKSFLRAVPAALAFAAAAFAMNAGAQSANPTGPGNNAPNKAGEVYPNDPNAANQKPTMGVVKKAENSAPVRATRRATRRAKNATKRTGHRVANAIRNTGDKIANKLPPAPVHNTPPLKP